MFWAVSAATLLGFSKKAGLKDRKIQHTVLRIQVWENACKKQQQQQQRQIWHAR